MQSGERIVINGREYRLGSVLSTSAGSYGEVWAATDPAGCAVALKFINTAAMSQADTSLHGHWRAHLEREIAFLADLNPTRSHHVVILLDHGQVDDQPVLVMERLQANLGQWLSQQRKDGAPPPDLPRVLDWAEQILDGLDVIHRAGFVYRDLKFSNILVGDDGALLKLADFGSLKREDGDSTRSCIGTPATMAPEQILPVRQGADGCEYAVDYRADYYALGLLLFTLLTEQPTTVAQRRLGQLLALHGQEGASRQRDQVGGLTHEEQALLRRSIEVWTVPARPEQQQGRAATLTELLTRLLACDPADRPVSSAAIRAVLNTVRAEPAITPDLLADGLTLPPDIPPNRHARRAKSPASWPRLHRTAGLIGVLGLASVLAWATFIRPAFYQDAPRSLHAVPAPAATELAAPPIQAPDSTVSATAPPQAAPEPPIPPQSPQGKEPVASAPVEPAAETRSGLATGSTTETATATPAESPIEVTAESPDDPTAATSTGPSTATSTEITTESPDDPTAETEPATKPTSAVADQPRPAAPAGKVKRVGSSSKPATPTAKSAASVSRDRSASVPSPTIARTKPAKAAPPTDESVAAPRPPAPPPVAAPPMAKPAPKPAAPSLASQPTPKVKAAPAHPARDRAPAGVAHAKAAPRVASLAAPPTKTARSAPPPSLPPIQLIGNTRAAPGSATPVQPPIELVSRASPAPATPSRPPIELISRASPAPVMASTRPMPTTAPRRNAATSPPQPPDRPADPITAFQKDANRAAHQIRREAETVGNWASRASNSVKTEIQRGIDSANQAINGWTGNCKQANGCQPAQRVERRDRWSRQSGAETAARSHSTP